MTRHAARFECLNSNKNFPTMKTRIVNWAYAQNTQLATVQQESLILQNL